MDLVYGSSFLPPTWPVLCFSVMSDLNLDNPGYPISTLPEHLHSTSLSYAETTLNSKKLVSFPLIAHYLSAGPPLPPTPPFTGRPGHTHT